MKTGKVAKSFGVDPKTVLNWTDNPIYRKFFSEDALGESGQSQRDFNENDVLVLNTIRAERARNTDWQEIVTMLEAGYRTEEFPPTMLLVESAAPIAQYGRVIALVAERDAALKEVERLNVVIKEQKIEKDEVIERLQQEIRKLTREIGKLEGKMESLEERLDDDH